MIEHSGARGLTGHSPARSEMPAAAAGPAMPVLSCLFCYGLQCWGKVTLPVLPLLNETVTLPLHTVGKAPSVLWLCHELRVAVLTP